MNRGPWDPAANVAAGVSLLREYYLLLGSVKAAILAYNAGPANYKRGRYSSKYWREFLQTKERIPDVSSADAREVIQHAEPQDGTERSESECGDSDPSSLCPSPVVAGDGGEGSPQSDLPENGTGQNLEKEQ